jgi:ketosteroid isomerase-like protein
MSLKKIANKLVGYCKEGKNIESINELYADNVVSVEAAAMGDEGRTTEGIDAIRSKNQWWSDNHEIHSASVEGPWPHGDEKFAVRFTYDVTNKPSKNRMKMDEIAVYTVEGGKIVKEEFFYDMG